MSDFVCDNTRLVLMGTPAWAVRNDYDDVVFLNSVLLGSTEPTPGSILDFSWWKRTHYRNITRLVCNEMARNGALQRISISVGNEPISPRSHAPSGNQVGGCGPPDLQSGRAEPCNPHQRMPPYAGGGSAIRVFPLEIPGQIHYHPVQYKNHGSPPKGWATRR